VIIAERMRAARRRRLRVTLEVAARRDAGRRPGAAAGEPDPAAAVARVVAPASHR
jgi:hypothetical protein